MYYDVLPRFILQQLQTYTWRGAVG